MYSLWTRANAVFFYGITALLVAGIGSGISTYTFKPHVEIHTLRINSLKGLRSMREPTTRADTDRAVFTLDLDADLRGIWNWNVKQAFVYVTANYKTPFASDNKIVVWDKLVLSKDDARLSVANAYVKYPVIHHGKDLRGVPVSLTLHWDVMPITGMPYIDGSGQHTVLLPLDYCSEPDCALRDAGSPLAMGALE